MIKINFPAIAAAILVTGMPALAAEQDKKEDKAERKICRPEPDSTSRIAPKICKTKAEWDQQGKDSINRANLNRGR